MKLPTASCGVLNPERNKDLFIEFKDEIEILKRIGLFVKYKEKILLFPKKDYEKAFAARLLGM